MRNGDKVSDGGKEENRNIAEWEGRAYNRVYMGMEEYQITKEYKSRDNENDSDKWEKERNKPDKVSDIKMFNL